MRYALLAPARCRCAGLAAFRRGAEPKRATGSCRISGRGAQRSGSPSAILGLDRTGPVSGNRVDGEGAGASSASRSRHSAWPHRDRATWALTVLRGRGTRGPKWELFSQWVMSDADFDSPTHVGELTFKYQPPLLLFASHPEQVSTSESRRKWIPCQSLLEDRAGNEWEPFSSEDGRHSLIAWSPTLDLSRTLSSAGTRDQPSRAGWHPHRSRLIPNLVDQYPSTKLQVHDSEPFATRLKRNGSTRFGMTGGGKRAAKTSLCSSSEAWPSTCCPAGTKRGGRLRPIPLRLRSPSPLPSPIA